MPDRDRELAVVLEPPARAAGPAVLSRAVSALPPALSGGTISLVPMPVVPGSNSLLTAVARSGAPVLPVLRRAPDSRVSRWQRSQRGGRTLPPVSGTGGSFSDSFADLTAWSVELGAGGWFEIDAGKLKVAHDTGDYVQHTRGFRTGRQIPAGWNTITLSVKITLKVASDSYAYVGLCFDAAPTGDLENWAGAGTLVQNAYTVAIRGGGYGEEIKRIKNQVQTGLAGGNAFDPTSDVEGTLVVTFTKLSDRVNITRRWNGASLQPDASDTSADRHTGACYVALSAHAAKWIGWWAKFDDLSVVWT